MKGAFGNPLVLVTVIGLLGNLVFTAVGHVPEFLAAILKMLGDSFNAPALFVLGYNMAGKISKSMSFGFLFLPSIMIGAKLIATPLVLQVQSNVVRNRMGQRISHFPLSFGASE